MVAISQHRFFLWFVDSCNIRLDQFSTSAIDIDDTISFIIGLEKRLY